MSNREPGGWLADVLVGAQSARWCTRQFCTTCGCLEFRQAFWTAAARQAGIDASFEAARLPREILSGVSVTDREGLVRTLVAGLRELPPRWTDSEAFRTIITDLDPSLIRHGVSMALDTELSGTPAGEALARMRAHFEEVRAQRHRQRAYESVQATEERRRAKRETRAIAHANRQSEARRRSAERLDLLVAIARLSPGERLVRFATDPALVLDCVPAGLIPAQELDLIDLERAKAVALLRRIGWRKGPWGRLRRMLERLAEPGSPT